MANPQDEIAALKAQIAALTARVYQLELISGAPSDVGQRSPAPTSVETTLPHPSAKPVSGSPPPGAKMTPPQQPQPVTMAARPKEDGNLETKIGQYWLNRIGIVAILMGVSYFLKYAFENNWIGPSGRVVIGLLAGIGLVIWSERLRNRGIVAFSYSLKAVGIGILYLSVWGAFQVYHLIPSAAAFVAMVIITAATITLALSQDAELLASFSLVGGFATPLLLSTRQNHEAVLFSYVVLLDVAILTMAVIKPWRRLVWGSFAGTLILYIGWYDAYYSKSQRMLTVVFAALFAALFAAIPLAARYRASTRVAGPSVTLTLLPLLNAAAFFLAVHAMYSDEPVTLAWFALVLAAIYLALGGAFRKYFPGQDSSFMNLLHAAIAIAFISIAIPLKLDAQWITIGWLVESAALLWICTRTQAGFLRYFGVAALVAGVFRLLVYDRFYPDTLVFNMRFATYAVAIAVLGGIARFGERHASIKGKPFYDAAVVALNLLALIALTLEASDYFARQLAASRNYGLSYHQILLARRFSYSAIWLVYGAGLMAVGFLKRSAFVRWQALALIAFTIGKVFLYDVSQLGGSFRIVSFIALGAVLLGISFIYQRDWLKLSSRSPDNSTHGTSP
jgi:uncharacterized membrane protein